MIESKQDYLDYLYQDRIALGKTYTRPHLIHDEIWRFERLLRKAEYYKNCKNHGLAKLHSAWLQYRYYRKRLKYGVYIPLNVFGPGLSLAHLTAIVVNGNCHVGKNCRIQEGVTLGATNGSDKAPVLGDNIFLGSGAKVIGDVKLADDIAVGANAVVVKSSEPGGVSLGGCPARIISSNDSHSNLNQLLKKEGLL